MVATVTRRIVKLFFIVLLFGFLILQAKVRRKVELEKEKCLFFTIISPSLHERLTGLPPHKPPAPLL